MDTTKIAAAVDVGSFEDVAANKRQQHATRHEIILKCFDSLSCSEKRNTWFNPGTVHFSRVPKNPWLHQPLAELGPYGIQYSCALRDSEGFLGFSLIDMFRFNKFNVSVYFISETFLFQFILFPLWTRWFLPHGIWPPSHPSGEIAIPELSSAKAWSELFEWPGPLVSNHSIFWFWFFLFFLWGFPHHPISTLNQGSGRPSRKRNELPSICCSVALRLLLRFTRSMAHTCQDRWRFEEPQEVKRFKFCWRCCLGSLGDFGCFLVK